MHSERDSIGYQYQNLYITKCLALIYAKLLGILISFYKEVTHTDLYKLCLMVRE